MLEFVINGLHQGSLVEITGVTKPSSDGVVTPELNGQIGQLVSYEDGQFQIAMVETSDLVTIEPQFVKECTAPDSKGFDVVLGPKTKRQVLGETMGSCLNAKGHCVLKMMSEGEGLAASFENLKELDSKNMFSRLPKELEEGHLGTSGRAKTMWLDPDDFASPFDDALWAADGNLTSIAETLAPFVSDALGCELGDRTAAMVCLSMSDEEEEQYERPPADQQRLLEYYNTWARGKLRMIYFMGPHTGQVILQPKEDAAVGGLPDEYVITASPNTIVLVREDTFVYSYDEPAEGESSWIQCFLLEPAPEWELTDFQEESLVPIFGRELNGPPPPTTAKVQVSAIAIQAANNMCSKPKEWNAYVAGADGMWEMPLMRFDYAPYYDPDFDVGHPWKSYVKHFSVLEGIEMFDNKAFDISNAEASALDPQNRQVLEITYLLLDAKGITKKYCNGNPTHASVSCGCDKNEWVYMPNVPSSVATNNQLAICANRVNYVFNLKGGSYVCDTACSSSLVAAHLGKVNLLEQRWDPLKFHLAMGTNLTLTVNSFVGSCQGHMLSPSGRCLTFNASASGYNRGDGSGGLFLELGEDEYRMAFLRGTQMGNDGRSASMAAPNGPAQEKCIWGAVREAQMRPPESTVWECHGTGTALGDPIEVGAVRKVQIKEPRLEPLMVATSKSNIGHLEGGAAAIAMVKCVVVVQKCLAAPTIHFRTLNPHLDHAMFDAIFCSELNPYKYTRGHCQVSSFGVGGTNGHAVFWGEDPHVANQVIDYRGIFVKKLEKQQATAALEMEGPDPSSWKLSGPGVKLNPGEKYQVAIEKDPVTGDTPLHWHKVEDVGITPPGFFSVTGNFNDWKPEKMKDGAVPGLYYVLAPTHESGELQFRFLVEDDKKRQFGPQENSFQKSAKMSGESAGCDTYWTIVDTPGVMYRLELMSFPSGKKTVTWSSTEVEEDEEPVAGEDGDALEEDEEGNG